MWQEDLARDLAGARPSERRTVLDRYETLTGRTRPTLYRIAGKHGFDAGRKDRADKGFLKCEITDDQIEFVAALMFVTGRENKGPIMPVERALQIAADNGVIEEGQASPATVNRILRERQISKRHMKNPEPHTKMRSLHPNHTHVFDVSVCIQYYLRNGRMSIMDERDFYKNKPHNFEKIKTRLLRYVMVDHFSGEFHLKFYDTTGETQDNLFDFLKEAWGRKDDERLPFRGVPFNLLMDTGAANKSRAIVAMLERLGVNIPKGAPYNPQRQGTVESMHSVLEKWFESGLRIQPAFDVETLNAWAADWMVRFKCTRKHTRTGTPRTQCWLQIKTGELRELPADDILQDLFANPEEECTVAGDYTIRFRGNVYCVKHAEGVHPRAKVNAILKPFKWTKIDISFRGNLYEAEAVTILPAHMGGFRADAAVIGEGFKSQPETQMQRAEKRFQNMAYGEERKKDAVPFDGLKVFGHHADYVDGLSFLPKQGAPIEVDRGITEKSISIIEFFKRLKREIGAIPPALNRDLRARYGDAIDTKEAEEVIRRIAAGEETGKRASV